LRKKYGKRASVKSKKYWSGEVTRKSNALDLERGVFTWDSPRRIAESLARSAEESLRRKRPPFQSAMSMLNFYINRAGKNLPRYRLEILEQAKTELRRIYKAPRPPVLRSSTTTEDG